MTIPVYVRPLMDGYAEHPQRYQAKGLPDLFGRRKLVAVDKPYGVICGPIRRIKYPGILDERFVVNGNTLDCMTITTLTYLAMRGEKNCRFLQPALGGLAHKNQDP